MLLWLIKFGRECANHNRIDAFLNEIKVDSIWNIVNIPSYKMRV